MRLMVLYLPFHQTVILLVNSSQCLFYCFGGCGGKGSNKREWKSGERGRQEDQCQPRKYYRSGPISYCFSSLLAARDMQPNPWSLSTPALRTCMLQRTTAELVSQCSQMTSPCQHGLQWRAQDCHRAIKRGH